MSNGTAKSSAYPWNPFAKDKALPAAVQQVYSVYKCTLSINAVILRIKLARWQSLAICEPDATCVKGVLNAIV